MTSSKRSRRKRAVPPEMLISADRISRRLRHLGREVAKSIDPQTRPIAIVVLQGAFVFAADLLRQLPDEFEIDVAFMRCESYGTKTISSGRVLLMNDIDSTIDLHGRTVLLIDDILDTGLTLRFLKEHLGKRGATDVRTCVLVKRRHIAARPAIEADFSGFTIGNEFVVGYGLDYAGRYRHLPHLAALKIKE